MTNQDRWLRRFRIGAFIVIITLMASAIGGVGPVGINAPLLTMIGSATIIITLFPISRGALTTQNVGTVSGTAIVMLGGGYWLFDALQKNPIDDAQLLWAQAILSALISLLLAYPILSLIIQSIGRTSDRDEN